MNDTSNLLKITHYTDSLYFSSKSDFTSRAVQAEQHLAEQVKMLWLASEKEKEAGELMQKAGKFLAK